MGDRQQGPVRYPIPEELFLHLSGRTGCIFRWLLEPHVQDIIGGEKGYEIVVNGKGDAIRVSIKVHESLR